MRRRRSVRTVVLCSALALLVSTASASPAAAEEGVVQPVHGMRELGGIWCATNGSCLGVGSTPEDVGAVVVLRADGSRGRVRPVPQTEGLSQIVCARAGCIAVGQGGGQGVVVAMARDGGVRAVHTVPGTTGLLDLACPTASTCIATAYQAATISEFPYSASYPFFVVITDGIPGPARPLPRGTERAAGISCPSSTTCVAVSNTGIVVLTSTSEGVWSPRFHGVANATGAGYQTGMISCPTSTTCFATAAGFTSYGSGYTGHPAMRRVGADGSVGPVQNLSSGGGMAYQISCVADATCTVVGQVGTQGLLIDVTNGVPGPAQIWPDANWLNGVFCIAVATCGVVGAHPTGAVFGWHGPVPT